MSNQPPNDPRNEENGAQGGNGGQPDQQPGEWWLQGPTPPGPQPPEPPPERKLTGGQKGLIITGIIIGCAVVLIPLLLFGACFLLLTGF